MTADEDPVTRATFKFTSQLSIYLLSPDNFLNSGNGFSILATGRMADWLHENGLGKTQPLPLGGVTKKFLKTAPKTEKSIA